MSRHRAVRNLDIDDVLEEDTYSDDYDENELDEGDLNDEDRQELENGLSYVRSVVGEDIGISDTEIKEALWYYYFDREETVNWVFDKVAKIKAEEEKQKKKAAKKAAAAASKDMRVTDTVADRKPRYRRPPARLYADVQPSPSPSPLGSSLQSLAQRATINNKTTQKSSSLQSLAQKAAGQRGMSALQTLASRQQQRTATTPSNTTTTTSPSSSPKPSSLAALAQKSSASKGRTSLAHLATRSNPSETSTRPPSSNQGLSALAKLASKPNMSDKPTSLSPSLEKQQQQQQQQEVEETMKPVTTPEKTLPMINDQPANPLCAKPSAAANFLFMHMYPQQTNAASLPIPAFSSIGQVFYDAVKPLDDTIKVFSFDVPSPDDVVMEAQSHRSGGQLRKS